LGERGHFYIGLTSAIPNVDFSFSSGQTAIWRVAYLHQEVFNEEDLAVTHGSVMSGRF
jgi:hypothetical protein